jgi:hypothetical protein
MPSRKSITELYAEFEKALAAVGALELCMKQLQSDMPKVRKKEDMTKVRKKEKEHGVAVRVADELCHRVVEARANPTNPIPEMLLKIAAVGWPAEARGSSEWGSLAKWTVEQTPHAGYVEGEALSCLVSLRKDLRAMQARSPTPSRKSRVRKDSIRQN